MKKFIYVLTITLFLIPLSSNFAQSNEKELNLTQKQKNFAKKMSNETVFDKALWTSTFELDITMDPVFSGLTTKSQAQRYADIYSAQGYLYTEKNVCVKILDYKLGELAYKCVGDQSET